MTENQALLPEFVNTDNILPNSTLSSLLVSGIDFYPQLRYRVLSKGGENLMTEQELIDMFIQERINMLLAKLSKSRPDESPEEHDRILQAEYFIKDLPNENRELVENYIEQFTDWLAEEEPYLYQQGFMDGVRVLNFLRIL